MTDSCSSTGGSAPCRTSRARSISFARRRPAAPLSGSRARAACALPLVTFGWIELIAAPPYLTPYGSVTLLGALGVVVRLGAGGGAEGTVRGSAADRLLVLTRRAAPDLVEVDGDQQLFATWLDSAVF